MQNKVFLFPLNNSLLLKKVTLPYHIFESRYRKMIKDAMELQIPVAVIPYDPSNNYSGQICIAGIPHILTTYNDGRMDIYITGSVKCRLTEFVEENPYKVYNYRPIDENIFLDEGQTMELESLRIMLERWARHFLQDEGQRQSFSTTLDDVEVLINYCAVFLIDELPMKRYVMEANSLKDKIQIILKALGPKEIPLGPFLQPLRF